MGKRISARIRAGLAKVLKPGYLAQGIYQHWYQLLLLAFFVLIISRKDLSLDFNLNTAVVPEYQEAVVAPQFTSATNITGSEMPTVNMEIASSLWHALKSDKVDSVESANVPNPSFTVTEGNPANTYTNMTYEGKVVNKLGKDRQQKMLKQQAYVNRFAQVAKIEMQKFGIPASIILAQGLIESNAGDSRLARKNNNHFGMKCFSSKCTEGHCSNFTDDSHKDFFRKYDSAWESYRAHSQLLQGQRYSSLQKLGIKDYEGWAHGLKKAGYATDPRYAEKLIHIIRQLKLDEYDN